MGVKRKLDSLGRVVIPKEFRNEMNLKNGEEVDINLLNNIITVRKVQNNPKKLSLELIYQLRDLNESNEVKELLESLELSIKK